MAALDEIIVDEHDCDVGITLFEARMGQSAIESPYHKRGGWDDQRRG
ncbi:MAG: hypothetical protein OEW30_15305 [Acidimicrobiia bacterium]|nr:hypothetical protein [Acidimicrobiia bacterium]